MNKPTKSEITPGLLINDIDRGEVMVLAVPDKRGAVKVQARGRDGLPYTTYTKVSSLRWQ